MTLPACGLYRTTQPLEGLPSGRLVSFHNHGDPGPGIYLPASWSLNRAQWSTKGTTVSEAFALSLVAVPVEGLYVVREAFFCCEQRCVEFRAQQLVQLGYDAAATPILFTPEWTSRGLGFPERGTLLEVDRVGKLALLSVARGVDAPPDGPLH